MRVSSWLVAAAVAGVIACGDEGDGPFSMAGTWSYVAPAMADPDYQGSCRVAATTISLTQTADSVHGTSGAIYFICTPTGGMPDTIADVPAGLTVRGALSGAAFSFVIDGSYWSHSGTRAGQTMAGAVTLSTTVGATAVDLVGTWSATKQ